MNVLLDTNVLLRAAEPMHSMHVAARDATASVLRSGNAVCIVSQNLYEFWVASTRPIDQNGLGLSPLQAEAELARLKTDLVLRDDTPAIRPVWEQLITKYQVVGKSAHDARLVAAMIVHGIERILTFNVADFQRYTEIDAISPDVVLKSTPKGGA